METKTPSAQAFDPSAPHFRLPRTGMLMAANSAYLTRTDVALIYDGDQIGIKAIGQPCRQRHRTLPQQ